MPAGGAAQGAGTIHPRRQLNALQAMAAIVVIAAMVALVVWIVPLARSGGGAEEVNPKAAAAGSAVYYPLPQGKAASYYPLPHGKVAPDAGSAPVHDDPWNLHPN